MENQKKILITGFEKFSEHAHNPSGQLLKDIEALKLSHIETLLLPVSYKRCFETVLPKLISINPDVVIATGLAADRDFIALERVAINCESARIPDNDEDRAIERPISMNGPTAYFSSLPIKNIEQELEEKNINIKISNSAGTYVCNSLMYKLLDFSVKSKPVEETQESDPGNADESVLQCRGSFKTGFVHLPLTTVNAVESQWTSEAVLQAMLDIISISARD